MKKLILILNDQLSYNISSLREYVHGRDRILFVESFSEYRKVKHHKKKIVFLLSAMRHFAKKLEMQNYDITYIKLGDEGSFGNIVDDIVKFATDNEFTDIILTLPSEYDLYISFSRVSRLKVEIKEDDRFLTNRKFFSEFVKNKKQILMEFFYREVRKKYKILLDENNEPIGGKWNYDSANRKKYDYKIQIPKHFICKEDEITKECKIIVGKYFSDHFGDIDPFYLAVDIDSAKKALDLFLEERLKFFGDYQDSMVENEHFLFHSHISFYLNIGFLDPLEIVRKVEDLYKLGKIPINSAEGFIRQIIGWREFVRCIYWSKMPEYRNLNFLEAKRKLPDFYWDLNTNMNCIKQSLINTKENAYAHHIQRLMVLGNFALLAQIDPKYLNEWYLIVYADAYEWVELPNVTGMILFADGGYLGSKPYAAGGSYINKMSDYCKNCKYDVMKKTGDEACPFNYLYWNFLIEKRDKIHFNPRLKMIYSILDKMDKNKIEEIKKSAAKFFDNLKTSY